MQVFAEVLTRYTFTLANVFERELNSCQPLHMAGHAAYLVCVQDSITEYTD